MKKWDAKWTVMAVATSALAALYLILLPCYRIDSRLDPARKTVANMQSIGTGWGSFWYSRPIGGRLEVDSEVHIARKGGSIAKDPGIQTLDWSAVKPLNPDSLAHLLVPSFVKDLPRVDAWGNFYQFGLYGERLAIRSPGSDGVYQNGPYKSGGFPSEDNWQDIVYIEDRFLRWPIEPPVEDWLIEND